MFGNETIETLEKSTEGFLTDNIRCLETLLYGFHYKIHILLTDNIRCLETKIGIMIKLLPNNLTDNIRCLETIWLQ